MGITPKFDLEKILAEYKGPGEQTLNGLLAKAESSPQKIHLLDAEDDFALIHLGGTISSAYSPEQESIIPGPYHTTDIMLTSLHNAFGINNQRYSSIVPFSKDSRNIVDTDLVYLLDLLSTIQSRRVLITCGTYMLAKVAELIKRANRFDNKIIGLTGSRLPAGFAASDAAPNVLSAITAINVLQKQQTKNAVFITFHGEIWDTLEEFRTLDLHPASASKNVLAYPAAVTPVARPEIP